MGAIVVWTIHNLYSHESTNQHRERLVAKSVIHAASALIVHSDLAKSTVRREFAVGDRTILKTIPHGNYLGAYPNLVEKAQARRRLGLDMEAAVVLFLGNIRPYKGVQELISSFRSLDLAHARLIIAGKPLDEATIRSVKHCAGEDPRIQLHFGFVPDDDVQIYMNASDVVALPYLDVLTSGAAVLAMSFGKPCVAPRSGCLPDVLSSQPELLYNPDDHSGLRSALEMALTKESSISSLGLQNLAKAQQWSWESVANSTLDLYSECISRKLCSC